MVRARKSLKCRKVTKLPASLWYANTSLQSTSQQARDVSHVRASLIGLLGLSKGRVAPSRFKLSLPLCRLRGWRWAGALPRAARRGAIAAHAANIRRLPPLRHCRGAALRPVRRLSLYDTDQGLFAPLITETRGYPSPRDPLARTFGCRHLRQMRGVTHRTAHRHWLRQGARRLTHTGRITGAPHAMRRAHTAALRTSGPSSAEGDRHDQGARAC
jgi:hypothetical protein